MSVAWYVHPPALAKADYSTIDRFLEGSLASRCGTEVIDVRWIGGEQLKHCSTHGNLHVRWTTQDDRASNEIQL